MRGVLGAHLFSQGLDEKDPARAQRLQVLRPQVTLKIIEIQDHIKGRWRQVKAGQVCLHSHQARQALPGAVHCHSGDIDTDHA